MTHSLYDAAACTDIHTHAHTEALSLSFRRTGKHSKHTDIYTSFSKRKQL